MKLRKTRKRTTGAIAALGVLAALAAGGLAVSGCGASATLDPVAQAALLTSQQAGARISLSVRISSPMLPSGIAITATGYIDERHKAEVMDMDLSQLPGISALPGGGHARMVFLFPTIYMSMPFLASRLPEGKTWMKIDLRQAAKAAGIDTSQLSSIGQFDPNQFLNYLRGSSGGVVAVDRQVVGGVATTHYRATLAMGRIVEHLSGDQQAAAKAALEKLGMSTSIPVDVWVDGQGRVRREQLSLGGPGASAGPAGTASGALAAAISGAVTINFLSFGPVPPILAPPSSQVFDVGALAGSSSPSAQIKLGGLSGLHGQ